MFDNLVQYWERRSRISRAVRNGGFNTHYTPKPHTNGASDMTSRNSITLPREKQLNRFWNKVAITANDYKCWLWTASRFNSGYGQKSWNGKILLAHRVSWMITYGEIPDGLSVLHTCDNRLCVNPKHLFLGTQQDNTDDMMSKGRNAFKPSYGDNSAFHKLTNENVIEIRERYALGNITQKNLADEFNVDQSQISHIVNYVHWKSGDQDQLRVAAVLS